MRSRFPRTLIPLFTKIVGKVIEKEDVEGEMGDVAVRVCTMHMDSRTPWTALWLLPKGAIPTLSYRHCAFTISPLCNLHCTEWARMCTLQCTEEGAPSWCWYWCTELRKVSDNVHLAILGKPFHTSASGRTFPGLTGAGNLIERYFLWKGLFAGDRGVDGLEGDAWQCSEFSHLLAGFDTRWYQLDLRHLKFTQFGVLYLLSFEESTCACPHPPFHVIPVVFIDQ